MLIEGKHCTLETDDPVKGQAIVNYIDWSFKQGYDQIIKDAFEIYVNSEAGHDYDGRPKLLEIRDNLQEEYLQPSTGRRMPLESILKPAECDEA